MVLVVHLLLPAITAHPGVDASGDPVLGGGVDDVGVAIEELAIAVAGDRHQLQLLMGEGKSRFSGNFDLMYFYVLRITVIKIPFIVTSDENYGTLVHEDPAYISLKANQQSINSVRHPYYSVSM